MTHLFRATDQKVAGANTAEWPLWPQVIERDEARAHELPKPRTQAEAGGGAARHTPACPSAHPSSWRARRRGQRDLEGCNPTGATGAPPTLVDGAQGGARGQQASYFQAPPS